MTRGLPYRAPLLAGLIAIVIAAVLVVHLQHRSAIEQEQRTAVIIRQVCERSAGVLAGRLRELFGAAVLHTIEAIGHRELKSFNLARVDHPLDAGMKQHAYVSRFFMWHERLPSHLRDEVLFTGPPMNRARATSRLPKTASGAAASSAIAREASSCGAPVRT